MPFFRDWRKRRILEKHPIPDELWEKGLELVPLLDDLSDEEALKLRDLATIFVHEKRFLGANGFVVDDTVRIVVACLACLTVLELDIDAYRGWSSIIVYRGQFRTRHEHVDEHGIAHVDRGPQAGESAPGGPIVLSWEDVVSSVEDLYDGFNVVIHELAHKLDMLSGGDADGTPPLHEGMDPEEWRLVMSSAFADLCHRVDLGEDSGLDEYATENESEFFAVMTEAFFEAPDVLTDEYPKVYEQLRLFYRQDPLLRLPPPEEEQTRVPEHN